MVIVIAVAIGVVLAVLFFAGVFNSSGSGAVPNGTPSAFSSAVAVAATEGQSAPGGPWTIVAGDGIGIPNGITQPNWEFVGSSGCTFTPVPSGSSQVTILGTPSSATPGQVATWIFFERNATQQAILLAAVSNGQAEPLILVSGCSTVSDFASMDAVSATADADSTSVAATFDTLGGSTFSTSHPGATQEFIIIGGTATTPGAWEVTYSTCSLTTTGGAGSWLSGYFYASNGNVLTGPTSGSGNC